MKILSFLLVTLLSSIFPSAESNLPASIAPSEKDMIGEWTLDLRPTPEAAPYLQTLEIMQDDDDRFTGRFYGSPIQLINFNKSWDKLYFAFKSSDNSHEYFQTGYIIDDKIFGTTFCPGRDFIMPWTGKRKK